MTISYRMEQTLCLGANRYHINSRVCDTVNIEKFVNFAIEVAADIDRRELQRCGNEIDVLGNVACLKKREPIPSILVLENGPFEDGGNKNDHRGVPTDLRLNEPAR